MCPMIYLVHIFPRKIRAVRVAMRTTERKLLLDLYNKFKTSSWCVGQRINFVVSNFHLNAVITETDLCSNAFLYSCDRYFYAFLMSLNGTGCIRAFPRWHGRWNIHKTLFLALNECNCPKKYYISVHYFHLIVIWIWI